MPAQCVAPLCNRLQCIPTNGTCPVDQIQARARAPVRTRAYVQARTRRRMQANASDPKSCKPKPKLKVLSDQRALYAARACT